MTTLFERLSDEGCEPIWKNAETRILAKVPGRTDANPSLSCWLFNGWANLKDMAGRRSPDEILLTLGLTKADLRPPSQSVATASEYIFRNASGAEVFRVLRLPPKKFSCCRYENGKRMNGLGNAERPLYRLPELLAAPHSTVYVCEGEKDVEACRGQGLVATCNPHGAGKFTSAHAQSLQGRDVVVIADKDQPGYDHSEKVRALVEPLAGSFCIKLAAAGKDAYDHFEAGFEVEDLLDFDPFVEHEVTESIARPLSEVEAVETSWLWYPYLPKSELTVLAGDGGVGKTYISLAIASALSRGESLPEAEAPGHCTTLYVTAEDDPARTLRPRAEALRANLDSIITLDLAECEASGKTWQDATLTEAHRVGASYIVFDPLQAFLGPKCDINNLSDMRRELRTFQVIARETGAAVQVVCHLNKAQGGKANYRVNGSVDIVNAARPAMIAGFVDEEGQTVMALTHAKANLGPKGPSLGYTISDGRFEWTGPVEATAADVSRGERSVTALDQAVDWLLKRLAESPVLSKELDAEAKDYGISSQTLRRAKEKLRVTSSKSGSSWVWSLPGDLEVLDTAA